MVLADADDSSLQADTQPNQMDWVSSQCALFHNDQMNQVDYHNDCHDDSTVKHCPEC